MCNSQRCSEPELRSLLSELRIQDEDEREAKAYKTKNLDKNGEMESIVRKKLLGTYDKTVNIVVFYILYLPIPTYFIIFLFVIIFVSIYLSNK